MFNKIKQFGRNFTQTAPFILSNTVILIPYLLFLGLSDGTNWSLVLPFTLFYTFRMTGLFLVSSLRFGLDSYTLLMIALLMGGAGSFIGILGVVYFPLFYLSSILLGLSASWLTPANLTVNYHEKQQGFTNMTANKIPFALFLLVVLFRSIESVGTVQIVVTLALYTLFYIMAYHTVSHYPRYELDFKEIKSHIVVPKELFLFLVFFILLFLLRNARLLMDPQLFDFAIYGFVFLFLLAAFYLGRARKNWKLSSWLNVFTFLSGMFGNFLFLFSTLYIGCVFGFDRLSVYLYLPYVAGVVLAKLSGKSVLQLSTLSPVLLQLIGLLSSLLILLFSQLFGIGIFLLSFWYTVMNSWLNQRYCDVETAIPTDRRVITKFTTQNKGSVSHQFLLMALMLGAAQLLDQPVRILLQLTGKLPVPASTIQLMEYVKWGNIGLLIIGVIIVYLLWKKEEEHANIH
ncbi:hypothetical protein A5844_001118 [Enterococcus sp. 10A9_DIV0425]|uniref:Uncharacterized protein n=1 Tax=Candidatus Enterococcus wittei TaxID=1987383 RepID=A0A242K136_9ENTE|nr:hypothetical protein [Enterococcus sp. 10A9_DIV0425]OTP10984.1 hypothetical protein A5844_001118 [Enterococcus sp. 10A9_DIV0425]THE16251.1 hypothetical protein E1H99_00255 [Enterococcus hirae]